MKLLIDIGPEEVLEFAKKYHGVGSIEDLVQIELRKNLEFYLANAQLVSSH